MGQVKVEESRVQTEHLAHEAGKKTHEAGKKVKEGGEEMYVPGHTRENAPHAYERPVEETKHA